MRLKMMSMGELKQSWKEAVAAHKGNGRNRAVVNDLPTSVPTQWSGSDFF
jgi:hypothetical protein